MRREMRRENFFDWLVLRRSFLLFGGFLSGITIHSITPLTKYPTSVWIILSGLLGAGLYFNKRSRSLLFPVIMCFLLGLLRFDLSIPQALRPEFNNQSAVITNIWQGHYGENAEIKIRPEKFWQAPQKVQVTLKKRLPIGSKILLTCKTKKRSQEQSSSRLNYYMSYHYANGYCGSAKITMTSPPSWYDFRNHFYTWRQYANRRISSALPGDNGVLVAGLLYGERNMSQTSKELFQRAGLTHLIAVSGSNFTIIVTLVFSLLLGLGLWRHQAFNATTFAILLFFGFVGFSASVARAAIMGWVLLLARHWGRVANIWHLCLLAATILCLFDPWLLFFDAGFALSFLATIGLVIWTPIFSQKMRFLPEVYGLREAAATTFSATLMTMPYVSLVFERISLAGLLTNIIAVPVVPWAMLFGSITAAVGNMHPTFNLPALGLTKIIFFSAEIANIFPWLDIHTKGSNLFISLGTYALIIRLWFLLRQKNDLYTKQSIFCNPNT